VYWVVPRETSFSSCSVSVSLRSIHARSGSLSLISSRVRRWALPTATSMPPRAAAFMEEGRAAPRRWTRCSRTSQYPGPKLTPWGSTMPVVRPAAARWARPAQTSFMAASRVRTVYRRSETPRLSANRLASS
jgi:hypothetical protein